MRFHPPGNLARAAPVALCENIPKSSEAPCPEQADAIALLKADHRKVEELFEQFEKAKDHGQKQELAQEICTELTVHATIEEEIFYRPAKRPSRTTSNTRLMSNTTAPRF